MIDFILVLTLLIESLTVYSNGNTGWAIVFVVVGLAYAILHFTEKVLQPAAKPTKARRESTSANGD